SGGAVVYRSSGGGALVCGAGDAAIEVGGGGADFSADGRDVAVSGLERGAGNFSASRSSDRGNPLAGLRAGSPPILAAPHQGNRAYFFGAGDVLSPRRCRFFSH